MGNLGHLAPVERNEGTHVIIVRTDLAQLANVRLEISGQQALKNAGDGKPKEKKFVEFMYVPTGEEESNG